MSAPRLLSVLSMVARPLVAVLALAAPMASQAQTAGAVSTVFAFNGSSPGGAVTLGTDGGYYGTSIANSLVTAGLVYRSTPDGSTVRTLHQFTGLEASTPRAQLVLLNDGYLYGSTRFGDSSVANSTGTIYRIKPDGTGFEFLHRFTPWEVLNDNGLPVNVEGAFPESAMLYASDAYLYGVTRAGGTHGTGVIYRIRPDGTSFGVVHEFGPVTSDTTTVPVRNVGGASPNGRLIEIGGFLYGVAAAGGTAGRGTVYRIALDGTGFEVLHEFTDLATTTPFGNADGASPLVGVTEVNGVAIYGVASTGGMNGVGTLYRIDLSTLAFTNLHSFDTPNGATPAGELIVARDGRLVGTTNGGGTNPTGGTVSFGTIYSIATDGTDFQRLHTFTGDDGYGPAGALLQVNDTTFVGVATSGGKCGFGTIYQFSSTGATIEGNKTCGQKKKNNGGGAGGEWFVLTLVALAVARRRIGA
ncbi:MAG: choice-of-anchor tandem repeat GloVer-containing protein [Steroidobacteraceae bacterium]